MLSKFISFIRRKVFRINKYRWDYQYSTGRWDILRTDEFKRLNVARDFLKKYASGGNILEIGCGEGVFFQHLMDVDYTFYEGIDLSEVAIGRIKPTEKSVFVIADMEKYIPVNSPYTVIVLNEVLNYSKKPVDLLKRYTSYLAKDGVFLIGMYDTKISRGIWPGICKDFSVLDSVQVQQDEKVWNYNILKAG